MTSMTLSFLMVLAGFLLLALGGEGLVKGAVSLARHMRVPPLIIGLTFVAFGTSAPELMVSVQAALSGNAGISVGNVVGSNIANILLVLGATALVRPVVNQDPSLKRDVFFVLFISIVFAAIAQFGQVTHAFALALLGFLLFYIVLVYRQEKQAQTPQVQISDDAPQGGVLGALLLLSVGVAAVVWGADILIDGAVHIAQGFGVPETIIGLTLVAFGTSLPELAISVLSAFRGQAGVAIGNVIGSNIFNIALILGVTGLITPLDISLQIAEFDVWIMLLASLSFLWLMRERARLSRLVGALFLCAYGGYIALLLGA